MIASTVPLFPAVTRMALATDPNGVMSLQPSAALPSVSFSAPGRNSYDYPSGGQSQAVRPSGRHRDVAVAGQSGAGRRRHTSTRSISTRLGVDEGGDVKLISANGQRGLPLTADHHVPRGVVWAPFNQAWSAGRIEDVIDAAATITDVRIERI